MGEEVESAERLNPNAKTYPDDVRQAAKRYWDKVEGAVRSSGDERRPPLIELVDRDFASIRQAALEEACNAMCGHCRITPDPLCAEVLHTCAGKPIRDLMEEPKK